MLGYSRPAPAVARVAADRAARAPPVCRARAERRSSCWMPMQEDSNVCRVQQQRFCGQAQRDAVAVASPWEHWPGRHFPLQLAHVGRCIAGATEYLHHEKATAAPRPARPCRSLRRHDALVCLPAMPPAAAPTTRRPATPPIAVQSHHRLVPQTSQCLRRATTACSRPQRRQCSARGAVPGAWDRARTT